MCDYEVTYERLVRKYGPFVYYEKNGAYVDNTGRIRRISHTRANYDLMDDMQSGILFYTIYNDSELKLDKLTEKYGPLTLTEKDYYVDNKGIIRRILPYTNWFDNTQYK